jgi:hypothetical protein
MGGPSRPCWRGDGDRDIGAASEPPGGSQAPGRLRAGCRGRRHAGVLRFGWVHHPEEARGAGSGRPRSGASPARHRPGSCPELPQAGREGVVPGVVHHHAGAQSGRVEQFHHGPDPGRPRHRRLHRAGPRDLHARVLDLRDRGPVRGPAAGGRATAESGTSGGAGHSGPTSPSAAFRRS